MSLNSFIHNELDLINAGEEVHHFFDELYTVFDSQGHSGGSAPFVINGLKRADLYTAVLQEDSLLLPFQRVLHRYNEKFVKENLPLFATAINFDPLTPLTGEDAEWIDHGEGHFQNKRCSSVFKDDGYTYYHYGYIFNELDRRGIGYNGYTNYFSKIEITFPFNPADVTSHLYYLGRNREIQIKDKESTLSYLAVAQLKDWAGYLEETIINPKSFFIKKKDKEDFVQLVNSFFSHFDHFSVSTKETIMKKNRYFGLYKSYLDTGDESLFLPDGSKFKCPISFALPLRRIVALIPNDINIKEGKFYTLRNKELTLTFYSTEVPTKRFQGWKTYDENILAFKLHWGIDESPQPMRFDKLGYELRLVETGNYLYAMRRRFGFSHPNNKDKGRPDYSVDELVG